MASPEPPSRGQSASRARRRKSGIKKRSRSNAQLGPKTLLEIQKVLENYKIILHKAVLADKKLGDTTQTLLRVIFKKYVPELRQDFEKISTGSDDERNDKWANEVQDLKEFENKMNPPEQILAGHIDLHESPLVLLLTLALKMDETLQQWPSETDLRGDASEKELNWGKLWGFPRYLEACKFQSLKNDDGVKYWPGLPHCVMTSLSIWATNNTGEALVSASGDKFEWAQGCEAETKNLRRERFRNLRDKCGKNVKARINVVGEFSRKLSQAFLNDSKSSTTSQTDEVRKKYFKSRSSGCHAGSLQSYHLQPQHKLPVYLPVVASVWTPDGEYKPACLLDRLRFCVSRPPEGEKRENEKITGEMNLLKCSSERIQSIPSATGCAEWDAFVTIIGQLDDRNGKGKQTELLLY